MALVIGLAALTAQATESDLVRDIQRDCTVCWRNARLDPSLWDDCTQEVCCRLLGKARPASSTSTWCWPTTLPTARAGPGDRHGPQAGPAAQPPPGDRRPSSPGPDHRPRHRDRHELGEILEAARRAVLSPARIGSSSSGPEAGPSPRSAVDLACPWPASATRSTRPSASWSIIFAIVVKSWALARSPSRLLRTGRSPERAIVSLSVRYVPSVVSSPHERPDCHRLAADHTLSGCLLKLIALDTAPDEATSEWGRLVA